MFDRLLTWFVHTFVQVGLGLIIVHHSLMSAILLPTCLACTRAGGETGLGRPFPAVSSTTLGPQVAIYLCL